MDQPDDASPDRLQVQLAALRYLVLVMLQRLDADGYASVEEIAAGARHDWQAALSDPDAPDRARLDASFREALVLLEQAAAKT